MEFCQARMATARGPWLSTKLALNQELQKPESEPTQHIRDCRTADTWEVKHAVNIIQNYVQEEGGGIPIFRRKKEKMTNIPFPPRNLIQTVRVCG